MQIKTILTLMILIVPFLIAAQNHLEIEGKAKILIMDKDNDADSVVVRLDDGTLAIRDAITLSLHESGDVKHSLIEADHKGWYRLDGRDIFTLAAKPQAAAISLGFTDTLPNMANRVFKSRDGAELVGSMGGNDSLNILQENIPDYNLNGTTENAGAHTHTGVTSTAGNHQHTGSTSSNGSHSHTFADFGRGTGNLANDNLSTSSASITHNGNETAITSTTGNHSHSLSINTAGNHQHLLEIDLASGHDHNLTLSSGGSGTALDNTPAHLVTNTFIYLGQ